MLHNLRYVLRSLLKDPSFTAAAVFTMALGIGVTTAVFSVVYGVLFRPLPFPQAERLVDVKALNPAPQSGIGVPEYPPFSLFETWREDQSDFDALAATSVHDAAVLTGIGPAERVRAETATANFFALLGAAPAIGRLLTPDDDRPGAPAVALVSHRFWVLHLGADPGAVGRSITLDSTLYTVVGVTSAGFQSSVGPQDGSDLWLAAGDRLGRAGELKSFPVAVVGRLRAGVGIERASLGLDARARTAFRSADAGDRRSVITPLQAAYVGQYTKLLLSMLAAVSFVLLIACANVSGLFVVRVVERGPALGVKTALGASRWRLMGQVLAEALVVSLSAGLVALVGSLWLVSALKVPTSGELPPVASVTIDVRVLLGCLGASFAGALLASAAPLLLLARRETADLLRVNGNSGSSLRPVWGQRTYDALLVMQTALTLTLLVGAGLTGWSFLRMVNVDLGFHPVNVVTGQVNLRSSPYQTLEQRLVLFQAALDELRSIPGVSVAALASGMPLHGGVVGRAQIQGRSGQQPTRAWVVGVTADYFTALGIDIVRGSGPGSAGRSDWVLVDETAARALLQGEDVLEKQIGLPLGRSEWTGSIVGIVSPTRMALVETPRPTIYMPLTAWPGPDLFVVARGSGAAGDLREAVRTAMQRADPTLVVDGTSAMTDWLRLLQAKQRFYALLLAAFAVLALALAAVGTFGAASYAVAQRTREIGLRIALGADSAKVVRLLMVRNLRVACLGATLGALLAVGTTSVLRNLLFEVKPADPVVLSAVVAMLLTVSAVATYMPARRAATADPMTAMRAE